MLENEPNVIVKDLVSPLFDETAVGLESGTTVRHHTGWYDFDGGGPQVTYTNTTMGVVNGGQTGFTAGTGDGGHVKVWSGYFTLNCWAGNRNELSGLGTGGTTPNPKSLAYSMAVHVSDILDEYAEGTTDDSDNVELASIGTDNPAMRVATDEEVPAVYRYEMIVRFTYREVKPGT